MDNKRSRDFLKTVFRAGSVPTNADFAKLIDSLPNHTDDKFERRNDGTRGDSLCIGAGKNGLLLSFFQSLEQAGSNWNLQLQPRGGLEIYAKNRSTPVLSLDPSGNVGIGTDKPQATLDVRGTLQAMGAKLSGDLQVAGSVTVGSLIIPGLGVIHDADSLRRAIGFDPTQTPPVRNPPVHIAPPIIPLGPIKIPPRSPADLAPDSVPTINPVELNYEQATAQQVLVEEVKALSIGKVWQESTVNAGREWQNVAGPFVGLKAVEVVAWVLGGENRSICHAMAVNIDGDLSSGAITQTQSYQGRAAGRIDFRWTGNKAGYYLQCSTSLRFSPGTCINIKLHEIL